MDAVATLAREHGLKWTTARVVELERGRLALSFATLILIAHVLGRATHQSLQVQDLLETDGFIELTPSFAVSAESLQEAVTGSKLPFRMADVADGEKRMLDDVAHTLLVARTIAIDIDPVVWSETLRTAGIADERAADRLGIDRLELLSIAARLWGTSLTAERDRRAGDAAPQARGQITRRLERDLRDTIVGGDG